MSIISGKPKGAGFLIGVVVGALSLTYPTHGAQAQNVVEEWAVAEWTVAGPYPAARVDRTAYPSFYAIFLAPWQEAVSGPSGMTDLGEFFPAQGGEARLALARHAFFAPQDAVVELTLEYADEVDLFFNGWRVYSGRRPPAGSVPSPAGRETVPLYVNKGLNEILLMVASGGDAWNFAAWTDAVLEPVGQDHAMVEEVWETPDTFLTPESVLKDPLRDLLYVSSFDNDFSVKPEPSGYISILGLDGEILRHRWVEGLHAPTGMDIWRDTLFVAEREALVAIQLPGGEIAGRWPIPDPVFPNDLVIDDQGTIYISDTRTDDWADSRVYRFRNGEFDVFANEGISRANGLWIVDGWLLVGSSGDGFLKRVELGTGRIETVTSLGAGIIDGIRDDSEGNLLVSRWEGQIFRISPDGRVTEILDALPGGWNTADFEYLPEDGLLLIPTFIENRVRAVRVLPSSVGGGE